MTCSCSLKFDASSLQSAVPACIYCIDNNMSPYIYSLIDPATVSALFNLKIVTAAILMRVILGRKLSNVQMTGIALIALGGAMTQVAARNALTIL